MTKTKKENTADSPKKTVGKPSIQVENSGFRADQDITIKGYEYYLLTHAAEMLLENKMDIAYPVQSKYINLDGEPVENPTEEELKGGTISEIIDIHKTFHPDNAVQAYCGAMHPNILEGIRQKYEIHYREVLAGRAVLVEDLLAEAAEEAKPKLNVVK